MTVGSYWSYLGIAVTAILMGLFRQSKSRTALALGSLFCVPGTLWLLMLSRWRESTEPLQTPDAVPSAEEEELEGRIG